MAPLPLGSERSACAARSPTDRGEAAEESGQLRERRRAEIPYALKSTFTHPCHGIAHGGEIRVCEGLVDVGGSAWLRVRAGTSCSHRRTRIRHRVIAPEPQVAQFRAAVFDGCRGSLRRSDCGSSRSLTTCDGRCDLRGMTTTEYVVLIDFCVGFVPSGEIPVVTTLGVASRSGRSPRAGNAGRFRRSRRGAGSKGSYRTRRPGR